ncbi:MAG TPA: hypothetical protein VNQ90_13915 [Chthoniobacteraceae bacterium]|nr:hypothetical protein [Chthoniobacteraceae bacterium]
MRIPGHPISRKLPATVAAILLAAATFATATVADASTLIYRQVFGNSTAAVKVSNVPDWSTLYSAKNGNITTDPHVYYAGIYNAMSKPTGLGNIGTNTPFGVPGTETISMNYGVVRALHADSQAGKFLFSVEREIDQSAWQLETISFYAAQTDHLLPADLGTVRVALKIDNIWHVGSAYTPTTLTHSGSTLLDNFNSAAQQINVTIADQDWFTLAAAPGSPFGELVPSASGLPGGTIQAFGLYVLPSAISNSLIAFDTYSITAQAIPEPSTAFLILSIGVAAGVLGRRVKPSVK